MLHERRDLPKMRTLPEAARELKAQDPDTCLSLSVLRKLVKQGAIPCVYSGRRALVDMDSLGEYLKSRAEASPQAGIRRIDESSRFSGRG